MSLSIGEKIRIILGRRGMTVAQLAEKTNQSRQNMSNKMARDNFTEKDLKEIAPALGCSYSVNFILDDTGEEV